MLQVEQATYVLMLVLEFKVDHRLKSTQRYSWGKHNMYKKLKNHLGER